jgi:hypothetical protein
MAGKECSVTFTDTANNSVTVRLKIAEYNRMQQDGVMAIFRDSSDSMLMWKKKHIIKKLTGLPSTWQWVGSDGKRGGKHGRNSNTAEGEADESNCIRAIKKARIVSRRAALERLLGRERGLTR